MIPGLPFRALMAATRSPSTAHPGKRTHVDMCLGAIDGASEVGDGQGDGISARLGERVRERWQVRGTLPAACHPQSPRYKS